MYPGELFTMMAWHRYGSRAVSGAAPALTDLLAGQGTGDVRGRGVVDRTR